MKGLGDRLMSRMLSPSSESPVDFSTGDDVMLNLIKSPCILRGEGKGERRQGGWGGGGGLLLFILCLSVL